MEFAGKVALITGAGSGIGRAVAKKLAKAGSALVLCDIEGVKLREVVSELERAGAELAICQVDVSKEETVAAAIHVAREQFGGIDLAVNSAGIGQPHKKVARLDVADWRRTIEVNLTGIFLSMKHEIPSMVERGGGSIANIASALGVIGAAQSAAYVASKHGVIGLTKSAALEYAEKGVRVNAVCPGMTQTPMIGEVPAATLEIMRDLHPLKRFATAEEIADLVLYLLSARASFITGANYLIDGGWTAH